MKDEHTIIGRITKDYGVEFLLNLDERAEYKKWRKQFKVGDYLEYKITCLPETTIEELAEKWKLNK